ncbi:MAG: ABC transporter ATP-binding protein [Chloroflexota bacterium]
MTGKETACAIEAKGLSVVLGGQKVLDVPTLRVHPNEVLMLIGPNGSGKTTLLLCLALLLKPAEGTITHRGVPGENRHQVLQLRRRLAVVFQEPLLLNSTVWDNVTVGLRLRGVPFAETKNRAQKWLERFGIDSLAKRQARLLSSGEAKRVSLTRAFALEPEALFLDEPFNALDSPTRLALLEDFESVLRETKVTTVMVTHDRNEALALAQRVAVIMNGSIQQIGSSQEIFSHPLTREIADFVGMENIIDGEVTGNDDNMITINVKGKTIAGVAEVIPGTRVSAGIRPEDITLSLAPISSSARNSFSGEITRTIMMGPMVHAELDCGFPLVAIITKKSAEEMALAPGEQVYATFKATAVHVMKRH